MLLLDFVSLVWLLFSLKWGIRLPIGGRRASPLACYNWQGICTGIGADFLRLYTPYVQFPAQYATVYPVKKWETKTFSGDYGHFLPFLV